VDAAVLSQLRDVGLDSIGGVLRLPKKSVASRFGPQLGMRLAQYAGTLAEPLAGPQGEGLPQATHAFDFPVSAQDAVEGVVDPILERLVKACVESLAAQGKGIMAIQVRFERSRASEPTASCVPIVFDIGLFQPSASVEHVMGLVRLRMSRLRLPREIEGIAVEVGAAGPTCCRQRLLFGENVETSASQVGMLLDRLSGRLGRTAVFEPMPVAELQPEYAWVATPVARPYPPTDAPRKASSSHGHRAGTHDRTVRKDRNGWLFISAERRPIWMPPQPLRLGPVQAAMVCIIPDGPPVRFRLGSQTHQVTQAHGPERIETAWWRGPCVRRDYYVVETSTGARYWLFRRLRDGVWFLHGMFA
jgi:protein ImuB